MTTSHIAVDLGASSGRVILGTLTGSGLEITEAHRFANRLLDLPDGLHWDLGHLYSEVLAGISAVAQADPVSLSVDTWGVDYGLISAGGSLLGLPFTHRDARTSDVIERLDGTALFAETGIQLQEINTLVQLLAEPRGGAIGVARTLLFMPDLLAYLLSGTLATDVTIASTSQLLDVTGSPSPSVLEQHGLPSLLPPLRPSGTELGPLRPHLARSTGFTGQVVVSAGHDTACAVAGIPAREPEVAFISCGTWALVGFELDAPHTGERARLAGFTNERGAGGTYHFLRNLTGLWLLNESIRQWGLEGSAAADLIAAARDCASYEFVVDPSDPGFLSPGDMPARIGRYCCETGQPAPSTPAEVTRCIIDSLALSLAETILTGAEIARTAPAAVHMIGGGSAIPDLCQSVADLAELPVLAGPQEATARGNILLQAAAAGAIESQAQAREIGEAGMQVRRYEPRPRAGATEAIHRFAHLRGDRR